MYLNIGTILYIHREFSYMYMQLHVVLMLR